MTDTAWERTDAIILAAVIKAAERAEPCPSRRVLARLCGHGYHSAATKSLNRLQRDGLIRFQSFAGGPVITIIATGKTTRKPRDARPHWLAHKHVQSSCGARTAEVPTPSFSRMAEERPDLAGQIRTEAFRKGMAIADFTMELVERGWLDYAATRPLPGASGGLI